jgi:hypothetical protein
MEEKERIMRAAMSEFNLELEKNNNFISGITYKNDLNIETQVRISYLKERFGEDAVDLELSNYMDADGNYTEDIGSDVVWSSIIGSLESKNK